MPASCPVAPPILDRIQDAIRYRGRDAEGRWQEGGVHLLHSRLSIIDLAGGSQPMLSGCGRFVIVLNGEIYNYQELAREYRAQGARFGTDSDTEVVLEGYKLKGSRVCEDLNGMFALAIWSRDQRTLFLARDRLGKKPLFWTRSGDGVAFASTLSAFRALPDFDSTLSPATLTRYLVMGAFPQSDTIHPSAFTLPAGSHMTLSADEPHIVPAPSVYWRPRYGRKSTKDRQSLLDEYESLLTDAVRLRLRADVPLALTFSGGVDSGSIATVAARRLGTPLRCYTVDYHTDADPSEETHQAEAAARALDLPWQHIQFDYHRDLLVDLPTAYGPYDQPCQQLALVYSQRLYDTIRPSATVVLSGNGADELFTGYNGDERNRLKDLALSGTRWARPALRRIERVPPHFRMDAAEAYGRRLRDRLIGAAPDAATGEAAAALVPAIVDEARQCGITTVMDMAMHMSLFVGAGDANFRIPDISGLNAQVEVRSPFLDYRMVEYAARLPHRLKVGSIRGGRNKALPKLWYARSLGPAFAYAPKKGMGWNLRWHRSIALDATYLDAFAAAYDALDEGGLDSRPARRAWAGYCAAIRAGNDFPNTASAMMSGFMLGAWLARAT